MKRKLLICILLFLNFSSFAFDGKRDGFILSLGAGISTVDADFSNDRNMSATLGAFGTRIGWGFGERFSVFFGKESHIYKYDGVDLLNETSGLGAMIFVLPDFYIFGVSGISGFINDISLDTSDAVLGTGSYYGFGYEFSKHFSIEFTQSAVEVDQDDITDKKVIAPFEQTATSILLMGHIY